jgi:hypothetical protein
MGTIFDMILWAILIFALVMIVIRVSESFPSIYNVDITDPLSFLDDDDDEPCEECLKNVENDGYVCVNTECVNYSDKH